MRKISTKIATFILISIIISACETTKRVPKGKQLLTKNEVSVNDKNTKNDDVINQLYQQPNSSILGYRLRLNLFNIANPNPDSSYQAKFTNHPGKYERMSKWLSAKQVDRLGQSFWYKGFPEFLKKTGEAPVIIDTAKAVKSISRLKYYYFNNGFFNVKANYKMDSLITIFKTEIKPILNLNGKIQKDILISPHHPILGILVFQIKKKSNLQLYPSNGNSLPIRYQRPNGN